jgi:hypothetical protein
MQTLKFPVTVSQRDKVKCIDGADDTDEAIDCLLLYILCT